MARPKPPSTVETAIFGKANIAKMFGKSTNYFFDKHGAELRRLGIIFNVRFGRPYRTKVAAFPSLLITWSQFKATRGEVI